MCSGKMQLDIDCILISKQCWIGDNTADSRWLKSGTRLLAKVYVRQVAAHTMQGVATQRSAMLHTLCCMPLPVQKCTNTMQSSRAPVVDRMGSSSTEDPKAWYVACQWWWSLPRTQQRPWMSAQHINSQAPQAVVVCKHEGSMQQSNHSEQCIYMAHS